MTENRFRRKISAVVLSAIIAASAVSAALPSPRDTVADNSAVTVTENADTVDEENDMEG